MTTTSTDTRYAFTLLHQEASDDSTLIVLTVRVSWTHGYYGRRETDTFTLLATAWGDDTLIASNGDITRDPFRDDSPYSRQFNDWVVENT